MLDRPAAWQRPAAVVGLLLFALAGAATLGGMPLAWPEAWAKAWMLAIEAAATLSIGVLLTLLFVGGRPRPVDEDGEAGP